jgi:hypothetical protein
VGYANTALRAQSGVQRFPNIGPFPSLLVFARLDQVRGDYTSFMSTPARIALAPWSERLIRELDDADQRAKALTGQLAVQQLNWQTVPGKWSIGQCLEHLCIANETYLAAIAPALEREPGGSVQEITPGWFARWFIRSFIEPSPQTKRAPAPRKIVPGAQVGLSVLDRFLASNQATRDLIRRAAAYDVNRIRFKNPFVRGIRFTVGTGLQIIRSHERRHLLQAERVKQSAGSPKPAR